MGNNKSILIKLQDTNQQENCINVVSSKSKNSISLLPVDLNKYSSLSSSSAAATQVSANPANNSSAGFLKRLIRATNNDLFNNINNKSKKNSIAKLNEEIPNKKKKYLILPKTNNKTSSQFSTNTTTNNNNNNKDNNDKIKTNANEPIKSSSSSIIKFSMNEILIEPEYTSISDCNFINTNKESFYESTLEIYDLIRKENAISSKKQTNLDANLYSEVLNSNSNNSNKLNNNNNNISSNSSSSNGSSSNNTNAETRLLILAQSIHKYNLNKLFQRFKLAKNKKKIKQPVLPTIPAKAFNPAKEFIYEQTKLIKEKDNEANIYFKIEKSSEEDNDDDDDDEIDGLKPPDLPPKLDYQTTQSEYECMKSLLISSSSASSTSSSNSSTEPPPVPPLPSKNILTQIEPIHLNNQLYYSFISSDSNDKYLIDNDYYSLNLTNMENLINRIISLNKTEQLNVLNSQSCINIETSENTTTLTTTKTNHSDLNSNTTNSSLKISSCASLNSNTNLNNNTNDDITCLTSNILKL